MGGVENTLRLSSTYRVVYNIEAYYLSQQPIHQGEWELNPELFALMCWHFGTPEIDLFARRVNRRVRRLFSLSSKEGFEGVDTLAQDWEFARAYAFPPLALILRIVQKLSPMAV